MSRNAMSQCIESVNREAEQRETHRQEWLAEVAARQFPLPHEWDEDACCIHCGFDGAEWYYWKHSTYEGRASAQKQPLCTRYADTKRDESRTTGEQE